MYVIHEDNFEIKMNSADGRYEVSYKPNVVIFSSGEILWIPPAIYKSSCTINVQYFPFDEQRCLMKFGSWTFNGDQAFWIGTKVNEKGIQGTSLNSGIGKSSAVQECNIGTGDTWSTIHRP
ncbi:hypothetical protein HELRODRAFT_176037 [Helobdella robusta]|uniref:Neurotransmitter-gated ion-channel ligand-binding domain-containing protein n=1 Tax=Helobdella robusta TaxID=6412 RepID=T1FA24_HELRO|nr:hypothetical protein HELRODRAFT_176037 [Helobdella robusta]ESO00201.1 hypothetical protein HELRODRAFT_176037 [Helobdella robusta]